MLRRLLVTLALLCVAALTLPAPAADAAPYQPRIPTDTHVRAVVHGPGHHVTLLISVTANSPRTPTGSLEIRVSPQSSTARGARAASAASWHQTVSYNGGRISVTGPVVGRGSYVATAQFSPSRHRFLPSHGLDAFRVGNGGSNDNGGNQSNGTGILPDTGGPGAGWLLLGGGLVLAGAATVGAARRQQLGVA